MDMALIEAAGGLDTQRVKVLLDAGANAAFLHDPPGTWGSKDSKSVLHMALMSRQKPQERKAVVELLLNAKADVNSKRCESDWRGCGSSTTAFEMVLNRISDDT